MEKTRRDFIANVSHELRTPLTSIQGYAETLLDQSGRRTIMSREFLEIIRKNAGRMSRLTEDLLTLARVESGEQRFDIEAGELGRTAAGCGGEVSASWRGRMAVELQMENGVGSKRVKRRPRGDPPGLFELD